jgi:predicted LPLAT superfamily acyltransferase
MEEMAPQAGINLMPVTDIGPETAMLLKEKLERNEWVAIVGDRIAVTPQRGGEWRVCWSEFMGQPAPFPQGPFILASILRCPVQLILRCASRANCIFTANPSPTR